MQENAVVALSLAYFHATRPMESLLLIIGLLVPGFSFGHDLSVRVSDGRVVCRQTVRLAEGKYTDFVAHDPEGTPLSINAELKPYSALPGAYRLSYQVEASNNRRGASAVILGLDAPATIPAAKTAERVWMDPGLHNYRVTEILKRGRHAHNVPRPGGRKRFHARQQRNPGARTQKRRGLGRLPAGAFAGGRSQRVPIERPGGVEPGGPAPALKRVQRGLSSFL